MFKCYFISWYRMVITSPISFSCKLFYINLQGTNCNALRRPLLNGEESKVYTGLWGKSSFSSCIFILDPESIMQEKTFLGMLLWISRRLLRSRVRYAVCASITSSLYTTVIWIYLQIVQWNLVCFNNNRLSKVI